jgi:Ca-activated chloride channel family protein
MKKNILHLAFLLVFLIVTPITSLGPFAESIKKDITYDEMIIPTGYIEKDVVRLVVMRAVVHDKKGRIITDLKKEDFKVYEDHFKQKISHFDVEWSEPVSMAFLLDVSGSMRLLDRIEEAKMAIRHFVTTFRKQDRFALLIFADSIAEMVQDFTENKEQFLNVLEPVYAYGQTALNDAIAFAPDIVDKHAQGKKAIILISDGNDNFSQLNMEDALRIAKEFNVPIYVIAFADLPKEMMEKEEAVPIKMEALAKAAEETGGLLFRVEDPIELKEAISQIEYELRHQYIIGYSPRRVIWDGAWRELKLEISRKDVSVRTRKGYYAKGD